MKSFLRCISCAAAVFAYSAVCGMDMLIVPVPTHEGARFVQKRIDQLTCRDYERISVNQEYAAKTLDIIAKFQKTLRVIFNRYTITPVEIQFLKGTKKDLDFLEAGYSTLSYPLDEIALKKFDSNLMDIYANSFHPDLCQTLAETYKKLAESLEIRDDFIRAAFWFRMLYTSGEHSSLSEYENMLSKVGL